MMERLGAACIGTGIHYPIPLHLQKAYDHLGYVPGDFSVCEAVAGQIVSLPMFPQLTDEQQARVVQEIQRFVASVAASRPALSDSAKLQMIGEKG